ncbi:hypothetical protein ACI2KR_26940 [Pseudomonas luteola]
MSSHILHQERSNHPYQLQMGMMRGRLWAISGLENTSGGSLKREPELEPLVVAEEVLEVSSSFLFLLKTYYNILSLFR